MWIADKWKDYEVIDCSAAVRSWNAGVITLWYARTRRSSGIPQKKKKAGSI